MRRLAWTAAIVVALAAGGLARADHVGGLDPLGDGWLAFRTGPGTSHAMLDRLRAHTDVTVLGAAGEWRRIRLADGREGWAHGRYILPGEPQGQRAAAEADARWIVTHSRRDPTEALRLSEGLRGRVSQPVRAYRAENGWYAVAIGPGEASEMGPALERYRAAGIVPSDSRLSNGDCCVTEVGAQAARSASSTTGRTAPREARPPLEVGSGLSNGETDRALATFAKAIHSPNGSAIVSFGRSCLDLTPENTWAELTPEGAWLGEAIGGRLHQVRIDLGNTDIEWELTSEVNSRGPTLVFDGSFTFASDGQVRGLTESVVTRIRIDPEAFPFREDDKRSALLYFKPLWSEVCVGNSCRETQVERDRIFMRIGALVNDPSRRGRDRLIQALCQP